MSEYKYSVLRYLADPLRDEPINIGLVLHSAAEQRLTFRIHPRRVASRLSGSDKMTLSHYTEQLEAIENELQDWESARFEGFGVHNPEFLEELADHIGNVIRFETPRGCVTDNPDRLFEDLFNQFVSVGEPLPDHVTKGILKKQVRGAFDQLGLGEYLKPRPTIVGVHRSYTLPFGIRHSTRTLVEILKLGQREELNYRAMAAVGRLWQDAKSVPENRHSNLVVLLHYANGHLAAGESLLKEDKVRVEFEPEAVPMGINPQDVREWA